MATQTLSATSTSTSTATDGGDVKLRAGATAASLPAPAPPRPGTARDSASASASASSFPGHAYTLTPTEASLRSRRKWGYLRAIYDNTKLMSLTPHLVTISLTLAFNASPLAPPFYRWLNTHSRFTILVVHNYLINAAVQTACVALFTYSDLARRPSWVSRYKIQPHKSVTPAQYRKILGVVVWNMLVVNTLASLSFFPLAQWRGNPTSFETLPSPPRLLRDWAICLLATEVGFYAVHRALHHPRLYRHVHKLHHEFTAPCAAAATYAHWIEHYLSNLLPVFLGLVISRAHFSVMVLFFSGLLIGTHAHHSGYNIPFLGNALPHDWHHYATVENFGPTGLLDALLGTDKTFRSWLREVDATFNGDRVRANTAALETLARFDGDSDQGERQGEGESESESE
ncbi:uncharacterized protein PFL1_06793 [Pseudozyma flocculosa PF-1]|uniref:Related to alpha-hydroxylase AHD1 n=2 Tax=Pseudozyma flocculosa TaxID=84751 RepID=A0A5C3FC93_9BASI|nr:uncharacterized protein PFL1_06793 [Pseudozyma flocculosa PF-1]EPQ25656.1 hypothetical protein PFL1_06793 [Pseudozyma flocculosa PF-1]SPO42064.1 related to alpha-hydroxylase AHD1 [Pseudozyma flocculosa]